MADRYERDGLHIEFTPDSDGGVYVPVEALDRWLTDAGWERE